MDQISPTAGLPHAPLVTPRAPDREEKRRQHKENNGEAQDGDNLASEVNDHSGTSEIPDEASHIGTKIDIQI